MQGTEELGKDWDVVEQQLERPRSRFVLWGIGVALIGGCFALLSAADGSGGDDEPVVASLASSVAATEQLEDFAVEFVQDAGHSQIRSTMSVFGRDSESIQWFGDDRTETRLVDDVLYELEGGVWYLKPRPAKSEQRLSMSDFVAGLGQLPAEEVDRIDGIAALRLDCDSEDGKRLGLSYEGLCEDRTVPTVYIDLETQLLVKMRTDGDIQTYPGQYEQGFTELIITALGDETPVVAPETVDRSRFDCIADALGRDPLDATAVATALDTTTTSENGALFQGCGFRFYPAGNDFE